MRAPARHAIRDKNHLSDRQIGGGPFQEHVLDAKQRHGGNHQRDAAQVALRLLHDQDFLTGTPKSSSR
jgi:hypothetical protein